MNAEKNMSFQIEHDTRYYTRLALITAVLVVLSITPIGSIPLPTIKPTTTHIPVIVGAILLGSGAGVFLGCAFGVMSVVRSTLAPNLTTFVFSPFIPMPGSEQGSWKALLVAFVPRILAGLLPALLYRQLKKSGVGDKMACMMCGAAGSVTNTVLVLSLIYLLFGREYAAALHTSYNAVVGVLMGVVFTNGLAEAILAMIVVAVICVPILRIEKKKTVL